MRMPHRICKVVVSGYGFFLPNYLVFSTARLCPSAAPGAKH